jgi:hypothetical protein
MMTITCDNPGGFKKGQKFRGGGRDLTSIPPPSSARSHYAKLYHRPEKQLHGLGVPACQRCKKRNGRGVSEAIVSIEFFACVRF